MSYRWQWKPYVPVAKRRAQAQSYAKQLARTGRALAPVVIAGRTIARTFWGQAWCDNLESYSDFANRLPRGRTYVRNGSVIDLKIARGKVTALVSGSDVYEVSVEISHLAKPAWSKIKRDCSQSFDSLIDLLQGRFSKGVMERLTRQDGGLFPKPQGISIECSCPDWATLCKHAAAVLYAVGARLDEAPEMLFHLRGVDHRELIGKALDRGNLDAALSADSPESLDDQNLSAIFGIDLASSTDAVSAAPTSRRKRTAAGKSTTAPQRAKPMPVKKKASSAKRSAKAAKTSKPPKSKEPAKKTKRRPVRTQRAATPK